jgi:hypothetical protein
MVKRFFLAAACLLLSTALPAQFRTGSSAYDDLYDSETVHAFKEHVSYLSSAALEGRKAGSEGEREAAEYMGRTLEKYGIDLNTKEQNISLNYLMDWLDLKYNAKMYGADF